MFFLENLFPYLQEQTPEEPEYRSLVNLETRLLGQLREKAGDEPVDKLLDAQSERMTWECRSYFLMGLRLGAAMLDI